MSGNSHPQGSENKAALISSVESDCAVVLDNVTKKFGDNVALDSLDLQVPVGGVYGLLGPNGAGKTTAVRIIATLLRPEHGHVFVSGRDALNDADRVRASIGLSGQYAAVDDKLTAFENLHLVARLYGAGEAAARRSAYELIERFHLEGVADRRAQTYSGGTRRRLDLASALIASPPLVILDEPTTGLDPQSRLDTWSAIGDLVSGGTTVLLTTQYLEEADRLAERIAVMNRGKIIAEGTSDELKSAAGGGRMEMRLATDEDFSTARVCLAEFGIPSVDRRERRVTLPVNDGQRDLVAIATRLNDQGVQALDIGLRRPTLDEVFFALTAQAGPTIDLDRAISGSSSPPERSRRPVPLPAPSIPSHVAAVPDRQHLTKTLLDGIMLSGRGIRNILRTPGAAFNCVVQPIVFVLLLGYVFGGSLGGASYREFIIAGIFAQTVTFNSSFTAIALATDVQKGLFDRLRSLPVSPLSIILGRTLSDLAVNIFSIAISTMCGLLVGWQVNGTAAEAVGAYVLILAFSFAMSWVGAFIGLAARSVELAQSLGLIWLFPVTFVSSGFVSVSALPGPLAKLAEWNPVTSLSSAARAMFGNNVPTTLAQPHGWPAQHPVLSTVSWIVLILAIFMPLTIRQYSRIAQL
ncbi:ATP-binding cassette domain-containing protein [Nocardia sp. bgisy118]|uniref:ATP-binding cassette domain-containing protein n=1 Tax=Nocardia sp. bgisy118 TaxID=3413786 RepID=UPI003F4A61F6